MNVMQDITIDVLKPRQTVIHVVQEDSTRQIRLTLLKNNIPFDVRQDLDAEEAVLGFVEFRKADGHGGMYDTTSLGDPAVELEDAEAATNVWIVNLDGQCFTCPGWTQINVRFETEEGKRIHTFRIMVDVEPTASSDTESTDWGELNSIGDLKAAVMAMWDSTFSPEAKQALMNLVRYIGFEGTEAEQYIDALEAALYQTAELVSISAVFDQGSATIYDTDDLETLRQYLTVTATYEDLSTREITAYTLSGTLEEGTSTITVSYGGKTATFDVTVTHDPTVLPREYQEVEWIEANNGPAINTLNSLTVNSEIRCGMQRMGTGVLANGESYFGRTSPSVFMMRAQNGNIFANFLRASSASFTGSLDSTIHEIILNKTKFSLDGVDKATFSGDMGELNEDRHVIIFAWPEDDNDTLYRMVWARCSYFQIYDNGTLVTDLVPCYRKADGVIGMYDRAARAFRTNVGTGTFTKGADV